jgi:hypothetical protein
MAAIFVRLILLMEDPATEHTIIFHSGDVPKMAVIAGAILVSGIFFIVEEHNSQFSILNSQFKQS